MGKLYGVIGYVDIYVLIWLYPSLILGKFNEFATLLGVAEYWGCKSFRLWGLLSGFHAISLDVKLCTVCASHRLPMGSCSGPCIVKARAQAVAQ